MNITKKILYIDMDGVIVDFQSGIDQLDEKTQKEYEGRLDEVPGIFSLMKPWENAIETIKELKEYYDIYILSTAPWENPSAWSDKLIWIKKYLEPEMHKRLILSHNKHLNNGDFLIDDRTANGADRFTGRHLHFNTKEFPNWNYIKDFLHAEYIESVIKD